MHLIDRFRDMAEKGRIEDMKPIPNKTFTFGELRYLYNAGLIMENRGRFVAVLDES